MWVRVGDGGSFSWRNFYIRLKILVSLLLFEGELRSNGTARVEADA